MATTAFLFPGQGSQYVGMGADLVAQTEEGRRLFAEADEVLGFPLSRICLDGPESELTLTANTQPALLLVSYTLYQLLGYAPDVAAGHSLGEYSALACAGSLSFADALLTVHHRGQYMQEAVPVGQGAMAALIGKSLDEVKQGLADVDGAVDVANWNSQDQIVISGEVAAVKAAVERIGARRSVLLPVSAPFHSRLMAPAEERLTADLATTPFADLTYPIINNVAAVEVRTGQAARDGLGPQVSRPVLWMEIMRQLLVDRQVTRFVEVGPGSVLSGLLRRTAKSLGRSVEVSKVETLADLGRLSL
ncbi:MAG: ACP S-malonyltransferase [Propionicimonas sp.]